MLLPACRPPEPAAPAALASLEVSRPAHLDTALSYVGTRELGTNRGPAVERFLRSVGLGPGNAYCAAFVSYCLEAAGAVEPAVRSGLAYRFISRQRSIEAREVLRGVVEIVPGTILVWRKGKTTRGHTGFVVAWSGGASGETVEANTGPGLYGNQRDGDGVWRRRRVIEPGNYFRITHFTLVRYSVVPLAP